MSTRVHLYSSLQHYAKGQDIVEVNGNTIGECLGDLAKQYPEIRPLLFDKSGKLLNNVFVSVNLESAYPEQLTKSVIDGDDLYIILIVAGG